jgi:myosin-18
VRYSQSDLSSADRRGLFWLLDEEAIFPGATDESFIERLLLQNTQQGSQVLKHKNINISKNQSPQSSFSLFQQLIKKGPSEKQFLLHHFQGTNPVLYNTDGWLQASRDDASMKAAIILLHESGK